MKLEERDPSMTSFPSSWTLSKSSSPITNVTQPPALLDTYPTEWSLSTIPESISDTTETQDRATSQNTLRGGFPIALSNTNETASSIISSPPTFERSWTLPPSTSLDRIAASGPRYITPDAPSSSIHEQSTQSTGVYTYAVPGNFRPRGYSNSRITPQSSQLPVSSESSSLPANGLIRRLAGYPHHASPSSAISGGTAVSSSSYERGPVAGQVLFLPESAMKTPDLGLWSTSDIMPGSSNGASYKPPKPAGFTSNQTSPHSTLGVDSTSLQPYRPPQPAGFGPENVTPQTSTGNQNHQIQHSTWFEYEEGMINSLPINLLQRNPGVSFAPIEIPVQTATLPTDANSWLYANAEHLYQPPRAPLTARAPWSSEFSYDEAQQRYFN